MKTMKKTKKMKMKIESFYILLFIIIIGIAVCVPTSCLPPEEAGDDATSALSVVSSPSPSLPLENIPPLEIVPFQLSLEKLKLGFWADLHQWYDNNLTQLPVPGDPTQSQSQSQDLPSDISLKGFEQAEEEEIKKNYGDTLEIRIKKSTNDPTDPDSLQYIYVHIYNATDPAASISRPDAFLFFADVISAVAASPVQLSNIPLPALLAQAYTEGGAGRHGVYRSTNNLFGIRAGPAHKGPVYSRATKRVYPSYAAARAAKATDLFRAYSSIQESVDDYLTLITTSPLYKSALVPGITPKTYLRRLTAAGYGSSSMVSTWMQIIKLYNLGGVTLPNGN